MRKNQEMEMTREDKNIFFKAKNCCVCGGEFKDDKDKVRDHDHRTGKFRGAAHNKRNINYFSNRYLPVVFHNLRGYDSHLIIKEADNLAEKSLFEYKPQFKVIPNSYEKFMSFDIGHLKFIDSFQFMSSSLENLVDKRINNGMEEAKNNFISQFEEHPVTQEIKGGPNAGNDSGTLNGKGNLFSFIGFEAGSNPIAPVSSFLKNAFQVKKLKTGVSKSKIVMNYKLYYPTEKDLDTLTPMPWEPGNSWLIKIEKGISGFSNYVNKVFGKGRSGTGLQSQNSVRSGNFKPTKYMSEIVNDFLKSVKKIK
jgi:hypothetical protein